nr:hypothetical protein [Pseudobdellovibrionaceae bacterium]
PRCGFSQPKDKYCAQCGVDMETYRPQKAPLIKRLITHPASFMLVLFLSIYLGYELTVSLKSTLQGSKTSSNVHSFLRNKNSSGQAESLKEALTPVEEDLDSDLDSSDRSSALKQRDKTQQTMADSKLSLQNTTKKELVITFYESKMIPFGEWTERQGIADRFTHSEEYSSATLNSFLSLKKSFLEFSTPIDHLSKDLELTKANKIDFFYGVLFPQFQNERAGHRFYVSLNPFNSNSPTQGQFYLQRFWYNKSNSATKNAIHEPPQQDAINEALSLEKESVFMIVGTLPRETPAEIENKLSEKPLFQLLKSEEFQKKITDLIILIEIQDVIEKTQL